VAVKDKEFLSFEERKKLVQSLGIESKEKYIAWQSENKNSKCHSRPDKYYSEWTSWGGYLGTGRVGELLQKIYKNL
jgi:hypothetical protein